MPRSDGTLYEFEKAKLKAQAEKEAAAAKPKPAPKLVVLPDPPKVDRRKNAAVRAVIEKLPKPDLRKRLTGPALEKVLNDIRGGLPVDSALILAGISRTSMERWRKRNPALETEFQKAEAAFESDMLQNVRAHAKADAKAAQWLLERRRSATWAPVSKQELTGKNGGPLQQMTLAKELLGGLANKGDPAEAAKRPAQSLGKTA